MFIKIVKYKIFNTPITDDRERGRGRGKSPPFPFEIQTDDVGRGRGKDPLKTNSIDKLCHSA